MSICRWVLRSWSVSCLLLIGGLLGRADAATLVNLRWVPDDTASPPADLLTLHVLLMPGEQSATVQVRAVQLLGEQGEKVEPVTRFSGPTADYVATLTVYRSGQVLSDSATLVVEQLSIPHDDLQLPDGSCGLAYEVRVTGTDGTTFVQPTPAFEVLITDQGRQTVIDAQSPLGAKNTEPSAAPAAALASLEPPGRRVVYYATNRKIVKADDQSLARFGDGLSSQLSFGRSQVNIPVGSHRVGKLEGPICNWWNRQAGEHFCVEAINDSPRQAFVGKLPEGDLLLFVHGFNNSLEDALLRTAQLRHDLEFSGPAVAFSWPSAGSIWAYGDDEKQVDPSVSALTDLLATLLATQTSGAAPPRKVHVLAHSMGNRLLLEAVAALAARRPSHQAKLGYVMLAAADVDEKVFAVRLPTLLKMAERVTYYYSAEDVALNAGRRLYGNRPVGLSPWFAPALDTINADEANSAWVGWGHRYYAGSDRVLLDVNLLVNKRLEPQRRQPPLRADAQRTEQRHWLFAELDD